MNFLDQQPLKIGVNYWPAATAIQMWSRWDPKEIEQDFQQMAEQGIDLVRFFLFTPDFVNDGTIDSIQIERYQQVLSFLEANHLKALPTLFIGHMSGQNYHVRGWEGEAFLQDESTLAQEEAYVRTIVEASAEFDVIAAWCLTNEMPNDYPGQNAAQITRWVNRMTACIRTWDPRPIVLGDGVWSPEISGAGVVNVLEPSGHYLLRELAPLQDSLGVHFYPRANDYWLQAYTAGFRVAMARAWKAHVFIEEFGHSTAMGSEANQALYYREVLFSGMNAGAAAVMNWCWTDIDRPDLRPYLHNPFEMRFGLRRSDGSFRPALTEMQAMSHLAKELAEQGLEAVEADTALIIPATFTHPVPFDWDRDNGKKYELYLTTYGALTSSGAGVACLPEPAVEYRDTDHETHHLHAASFEHAPDLLWLPAMKRLSAPFFNELLDAVRNGRSFYASFALDHWIIDLDRVLGIRSHLRFGLPDPYPDETLTIRPGAAWDGFGEFEIPLGEHRLERELAYLPADVLDAEILLEDDAGRPLLLQKPWGRGTIIFALFPFEMLMLRSGKEAVRHLVTRIYARARSTFLNQGLHCKTAAGEIMRFASMERERAFLFNHAWDQREFELQLNHSRIDNKYIRVELPPKSFCELEITVPKDEEPGLAGIGEIEEEIKGNAN